MKLPLFLLILLLGLGWYLVSEPAVKQTKYKRKVKKYQTTQNKNLEQEAKKSFLAKNYKFVVDLLGVSESYNKYEIQKMLAYSLAAVKRFDAAIVAFEKLLKIKKYPEDGYSLAYLYEITGRTGVARMMYQDLLSAPVKSDLKRRIYEGLARTANFENNTKLALKYNLQMIKRYPDSALGFISIFKIFKNIGKAKKLDKIVSIGDKYHSNDFEYNFWLGLLYFDLGLYDKALVRLRKCIKLNPENSTPFYYTYRILKKQKNIEQALEDLEAYYERNPLLPNVFFEAAIDAKNEGRPDLAYKFICSALTLDRTLLGKDDKGALRAAQRYIEQNGTKLEKMFFTAFMNYVNGDTELALKQAKALLPKVKGKLLIETRRIVGECYQLLSMDKQYEEYMAQLRREQELAAQRDAALKNKFKENPGKVTKANEDKIEKIKQMAMLAPNDLKKQYLAGLQLARLGEIEDAKTFFRNAIRLNPNILEPNFSLAKLLAFQKNYREAEEYLQKALSISPNNSQVLSLSASVKLNDNDLRGAESDAQSALLANPNNGEACLVLAEIYSQSHRFDEAMEQIQQGLEVERNPERRKRLLAIRNRIRSYR